jgi:hypothetical protein
MTGQGLRRQGKLLQSKRAALTCRATLELSSRLLAFRSPVPENQTKDWPDNVIPLRVEGGHGGEASAGIGKLTLHKRDEQSTWKRCLLHVYRIGR